MKKVVAAIDFGTSGTTYAFSFYDKKENIITGKWNISQEKCPTEIILDESLNTIKFGNECEKYLSEQSSSESKFYYFKNIKMELYKDETEITADNGGSRQPLAFVISKILIEIKKEAIKAINSRDPEIIESDIEWKVTIPAIWKNKSKDIMRRACQSAGIFNQKEQSTFFALEPEAAACDYVKNNGNENAIKPEHIYIICDIGGGTVDISTHKRFIENGEIYIEEVYPPVGGNNGSTYINKKFIDEVIIKLFGSTSLNKLLEKVKDPSSNQDIYSDYCEFLKEIEDFKINISEENKNESRRIKCNIFSSFLDKNINIDNLIENFNNNCFGKRESWKIKKNTKYKIYFPYQIMIDLTKELIVDKVVNYINDISKYCIIIDSIIYAGSVSSNSFVISMIKKELENKNIISNHYLTMYPSISVVKGAVIFGLNPYIVKRRISKFTIGVNCDQIWDEKRHKNHPEKKYFDTDDNCYRCKDIFSPIIEKNKKIEVNEINSKHYLLKSSKASIRFYKTLYNNVTFIDEKIIGKYKCQIFGGLIFDVGDEYDKDNTNLIIELKLGGTFISAQIKYKKKIQKVDFDFTDTK